MGRCEVEPNLENCNEAELRAAMRAARSLATFRRLEVIFMFGRGLTRNVVVQATGMSERTIRRIILLFNARGIDGLIEKKHRGRPKKLPEERRKELVEKFCNPIEGMSWSARKFHGYLRETEELDISYATVRRLLLEEGLSLQVPRPWPVEQDEERRAAFCKQLELFLNDPDIEIWFLDETGIEGNPRPRRAWFPKGSRPKQHQLPKHIRTNICGMVCPRTGAFFGIELPYSDSTTFQCFLDEANKTLAPSRKRSVVVLDNASWHKVRSLRWGAFEPFFLPPYSPDLNPIERLWLSMKARFFAAFLAKTFDDLSNRVYHALRYFVSANSELISLCRPTLNGQAF